MGTNYYAELNACPCCKRGEERLHIGKSSGGWAFLFAPYPEHGLTSWGAWREFLRDKPIHNEYGNEVTLDDLSALVEAKKEQWTHITAPESAWGRSERRGKIDPEGYAFCDTAEFF